MYSADVSTPSRSASTGTPSQTMSSFVHFVTQLMSTVIVSLGKARNSSQVQRCSSSTSPTIVKSHSSSGVCGVGPAESTGKSSVTYWPGGTRSRGASSRLRPLNPLEMIGMATPSVANRQHAHRSPAELRHALVTDRQALRLLRRATRGAMHHGGGRMNAERYDLIVLGSGSAARDGAGKATR